MGWEGRGYASTSRLPDTDQSVEHVMPTDQTGPIEPVQASIPVDIALDHPTHPTGELYIPPQMGGIFSRMIAADDKRRGR